MLGSRSTRAEHLPSAYQHSLQYNSISSSSSSQTAMECEPIAHCSTSSGGRSFPHGHTHGRSRYQPTAAVAATLAHQRVITGTNNNTNSGASSLQHSYAPTSLSLDFGPPSLDCSGYFTNTDPSTASTTTSNNTKKQNVPRQHGGVQPTGNSGDRDDSPMVGVCVQQSPVAIH